MNLFRRIYSHFCRKAAFRLINGIYRGPKSFKAKNRLLRLAGFNIGKGTKIVGPIYITTDISIGENCWIGAFFKSTGNGKVTIGNNCDLGPEVSLSTGSHRIGDSSRRAGAGFNADIEIGDGCWIGQRSLLLAGVSVSRGSIVAAGTVVTKSFSEENILLAGIPAGIKRPLY